MDYLLANGASLIVHDLVTKRTPLHAAGMRNNNNNNNNNNCYLSLSLPLMTAGNGHVECVQMMLRYLNKSAQIDVVDNQGR